MVAGASLEDLATLGKSPLLSGLGIKDVSALVEQLDQVAVTAGTTLAREEEPGDHLSIILQGQARVTRKGMVLSTLSPGDYFGGLALARVKRGSVTVESVQAEYSMAFASSIEWMPSTAGESNVAPLRMASEKF